MNILIKKKHFFFGSSIQFRIAKLYFKKAWSNIFIRLEDLKNKTITCKTAGMAGFTGNKRRKKTVITVDKICSIIYPYFKLYNIQYLIIVVKKRLNRYYKQMIRYFISYGITIIKYLVLSYKAHNGPKGRKLRKS